MGILYRWLRSSRRTNLCFFKSFISYWLKTSTFRFSSSAESFYFPSSSTLNISCITKLIPSTYWITPIYACVLTILIELLLPLLFFSFTPQVSLVTKLTFRIFLSSPFLVTENTHVPLSFTAFTFAFAASLTFFYDPFLPLPLTLPTPRRSTIPKAHHCL